MQWIASQTVALTEGRVSRCDPQVCGLCVLNRRRPYCFAILNPQLHAIFEKVEDFVLVFLRHNIDVALDHHFGSIFTTVLPWLVDCEVASGIGTAFETPVFRELPYEFQHFGFVATRAWDRSKVFKVAPDWVRLEMAQHRELAAEVGLTTWADSRRTNMQVPPKDWKHL